MPRSDSDPHARVCLPVARVAVDVPLPHLDRPFDYRVDARHDRDAVPGARVRVRFAGRPVAGYVLERSASTAHSGSLAPLQRVVSPEPVLTPDVADLCRRVADHYGGTMADVLRLAVPPRHARTEQAAGREPDPTPPAVPGPGSWARYPSGASLVDVLATSSAGTRPRAVASLLPGEDWPDLLARAGAATLAGGRGAVVVLPDRRDVTRVDAAVRALIGPGHHVVLHADQGPSARYRRFLAVLRGESRLVVGTRSAVFAPVHDLGLLAVWDDGDDLLAESRAPYPHARDVALIRAHQQGAAVVLAGFGRTAEAQRLLADGWAHEIRAGRADVRRAAPLVHATTDDVTDVRPGVRLPDRAWRTIRDGLARGPVLVQTPRRGYRPTLACRRCRGPARCSACAGPLEQRQSGLPPTCRWCGQPAVDWTCRQCGSSAVRAGAVGEERTAQELGRAFPGVPVRPSGHGHVLERVPDEPALVVATPGAEPTADGGYRAAVLLDAATLLARPELRAGEEAVRRWMNAAALVRPAADDGRVVVVGDPGPRAVQAVIRWDAAGFSRRELADRQAARLPPAWRVAELTGPDGAVTELVALADLPPSADLLGPVPVAPAPTRPPPRAPDHDVRALLRTPLSDGRRLSRALRAAAGVRSARRAPGAVRIRIDPVDLG